ncbi:hypothetical protein CSUI_007192 [Cystoisospora suis]|uniref:Uncharacterized protein n=1 Tax=Cystoisospora suis TaxID=483139 RepID=A0A2C6KEQ5_9APIC|nr:hypothetical protein CSUI_007192 [Cystoisospora suis]
MQLRFVIAPPEGTGPGLQWMRAPAQEVRWRLVDTSSQLHSTLQALHRRVPKMLFRVDVLHLDKKKFIQIQRLLRPVYGFRKARRQIQATRPLEWTLVHSSVFFIVRARDGP